MVFSNGLGGRAVRGPLCGGRGAGSSRSFTFYFFPVSLIGIIFQGSQNATRFFGARKRSARPSQPERNRVFAARHLLLRNGRCAILQRIDVRISNLDL